MLRRSERRSALTLYNDLTDSELSLVVDTVDGSRTKRVQELEVWFPQPEVDTASLRFARLS